jgi:siroheme synthase
MRLLGRGWAPSTPAALLLASSTTSAHTWIGTLEDLGGARLPQGLEDGPGTIVIGEVVALAPIVIEGACFARVTARHIARA